MKGKVIVCLLLASLLILLTACSSGNSKKDAGMDYSHSSDDMATAERDSVEFELSNKDMAVAEENDENLGNISTNRMIIRRAQLRLKVKDFNEAQLNMEKKVSKYGGYIVESNNYRENESRVHGNIIVRLPEEHFLEFLMDAEGEAADVLERVVTGEEVTEQYIDLESRLKSKRVVEERLLEFMGSAEKTEDLLKISSDLAKVQEEIETIVGKMNYLENQTSFSTIEINMFENLVVVPGLDGKDLDTWQKTKKQFAISTNFLLAASSGLIVFIIGNLPVIVLISLVGGVIYFFVRRNRKKYKKVRDSDI